jgi:hypothetical protein
VGVFAVVAAGACSVADFVSREPSSVCGARERFAQAAEIEPDGA